MIQEMIEKLVAEAQKEASHKAFCDKEMSETEATAMRDEEAAAWAAAKADFESGIEGVQMALQVLRDYYAEKDASLLQTTHDKATGAASGIIGMLEVVESDFTKNLAEGSAAEAMAQDAYEKLTQDNKIATTEKSTAAKYKAKDQKETEAALAGLKEDREGTQKELDSILEYWDKLQPMCVAKPESYEERKKRREAEIAGLKQALRILEEESGGAAFLQIRAIRRA